MTGVLLRSFYFCASALPGSDSGLQARRASHAREGCAHWPQTAALPTIPMPCMLRPCRRCAAMPGSLTPGSHDFARLWERQHLCQMLCLCQRHASTPPRLAPNRLAAGTRSGISGRAKPGQKVSRPSDFGFFAMIYSRLRMKCVSCTARVFLKILATKCEQADFACRTRTFQVLRKH